jgi:hypothetical protein
LKIWSRKIWSRRADSTHASLIEDKGDAAMASQAIHDVIESIRASTSLTKA